MGFWSWLGRVAGMPDTPPSMRFSESAPRPIDQMFMDLRAGGATAVSRAEAMSVPAVQKGRNMLCAIATLPLVQRDPSNNEVRNPLLEQIDPDVPNVVTLAQTIEDLIFEGVAWWRVTGVGFDMYPMTARRLDPNTVSFDPPVGRSPDPLPSGLDPRTAPGVYVDGTFVPADQIIRFDSPNAAVLKVCGRAIKRAVLFDKAARLYADGGRPLDYFSPSDGVDPADDDEITGILDGWKVSRKQGSTAYVPAALTYNVVDSPSPADLQLVELQKQVTLEIANALGVDPEDLGVSTTSRTYANAVDRRRDRVNDVLSPYMRAVTDRLSMGDVTKRGYLVGFLLDDYMKSNPTERWSTYEKGKALGVYTVDDIRRMEGLPPMGDNSTGPTTRETPVVADPTEVAAAHRVSIQLDAPKLRFADVPVTEFSVDVSQRTIEGIALPYGKIGTKFGVGFRFERGSLQYGDPTRIKLLRDHDYTQALGYAESIKDTATGVKVRFKVARGTAGDEALALAEDKVLDGLSVGVDFNEAVDTVPDPKNKGGLLVRRADWRETSLTPMPAFDDARVTRVAASRDGGEMPETATSGQTPAAADPATTPPAPASSPVQFTADQLAQLRTALGLAEPVAPAPEPRPTVNPTRLTATVAEAKPYRFDSKGNLRMGSHDFSQDLIATQQGDKAAEARALEFVRAQFDVATGDVNELNPTTNRPEMYVDQRSFRYPVWDAISKGTLDNITPFTFPKFSSASGLVGDHTEGTEPTSGTLVTTSQTVTPTAVSGKAKITREVWDQGGNPQVSNLIWNQMVKGWFEALEAAAVAVLDAATPTAIALTAGGGTDGQTLDAELTAAFAALQYIRGGFSMDNMFTQIDLYKALIAAKDDGGRRLYPALGPNNAMGTVTSKFAALDINGVTALPAWALAATGTVVASSYLFDGAVVHGWATAPQRLNFDIEVAHVYIGLWGYKATAISDITGVREITYDPTGV